MLRRLLTRVVLLVILTVIAAGTYAGIRAHRYLNQPIDPAGGRRTITIAPGQSFRAIIDGLHADDIVRDPLVFELFARVRKVSGKIEAGTYTINLADSPKALLHRLTQGSTAQENKVTLPEGLNKWQVADRLAAKGLVDRASFLARVDRDDLEGRLFPDTYRFPPKAGLDVIVGRLTGRFEQVWAQVLTGHPHASTLLRPGKARRKMLIIASLIEKEARTDRDRRLVSRVFQNRMKIKMKLQTDPTCVYGSDLYTKRAHPRYCKDPKSRYSTYVIPGLPPTPIANPGRASLTAALHPATGSGTEKLLFFVARRDDSGEHAFTKTYAEHRAAVKRYLK